jgi:hypothetical protein
VELRIAAVYSLRGNSGLGFCAIIQKQLSLTPNYARVRCEVRRGSSLCRELWRTESLFASLHFYLPTRKLQNIQCFIFCTLKHGLPVSVFCVQQSRDAVNYEKMDLRF